MLTTVERTKVKRFRGRLSSLLGDNAELCRHLLDEHGRYRFSFSLQEKKSIRRKKKISPVEWAPVNFRVPYGPYEARPFSFDITPHLYGMLEAYCLPHIKKIAVCAAPQTTKTTFAHVATAWSSEFEPGRAMHLYPNENAAEEIMDERIQKIYELSPSLRRLMTGRKEDKTKKKLRLINQVISMAWAGSLTELAHRSIKIGVADEVDKYDEMPRENEASTLDLLKLRFRVYMQRPGAKLLILSSPSVEDHFIWVEISKESEALFVFWSRCPYCGTMQLMDFTADTFVWPKGEDGHSLDRKEILAKSLARYVCTEPSCRRREWDDDARLKAQQLAMKDGWRLKTEDGSMGEEMKRYLKRNRCRSIGFIVPSWISKFVSLSEVAHDYLKCKDAGLSPEEQFLAYKNFQNAHRALPWKVELQVQPVARILQLCDDRPEGRLPGGGVVASLVGLVDTQDNGQFFLSLFAVGYGFTNDQWLVLRKEIHSFREIAETLWDHEYYDADGIRHIVEHAMIDMLGHRTKEVLEFCLEYEGLITPYFGSARTMTEPFSWSMREYLPGSDTPLPNGGIRAMRVNTKYYKDNMAIKLSQSPGSPGSLRLYRDVGEDYCKQLIAEARDDKGNWKQLGSRPNHYGDNWMAANALADWLGIKHRQKPEAGEAEETDDVSIVTASSTFMG